MKLELLKSKKIKITIAPKTDCASKQEGIILPVLATRIVITEESEDNVELMLDITWCI